MFRSSGADGVKLFSGIYNAKNNALITNKHPLIIIGNLTDKLPTMVLSIIPITAPICPACAPFIYILSKSCSFSSSAIHASTVVV